MPVATTLAKPIWCIHFTVFCNSALQEKESGMKVEITGFSCSVAAIGMGTKLNHLSALKSPCNQICDYLLIFELEGKDHAIFIELKKTLRGDNRPKDQLLRSLPLLKYLQTVCEINSGFGQNKMELSIGYCLIGEKRSPYLDKQPVHPKADLWEAERYKGIGIRSSVAPKIPLVSLVSVDP